jgi:outer membrane lipoprotein
LLCAPREVENENENAISIVCLFSRDPFGFRLCTCYIISKDIRNKSDLSLTLKQVLENPNAYFGKSVVWGGEIIQVINQDDGTTEIEIFQEPLNFRGEPKDPATSEGRFLVLDDKFLDPYIYWEGRRITVAGELQGVKIEPLGEMYYRYPLVTSKQIYLWPDYYPYPYGWGYYDPWWAYPYGWWGVGYYGYYYYHHHHHHHYYPPHHVQRGSSGLSGKRGSSGGRSRGSSGSGHGHK